MPAPYPAGVLETTGSLEVLPGMAVTVPDLTVTEPLPAVFAHATVAVLSVTELSTPPPMPAASLPPVALRVPVISMTMSPQAGVSWEPPMAAQPGAPVTVRVPSPVMVSVWPS